MIYRLGHKEKYTSKPVLAPIEEACVLMLPIIQADYDQ